MKATLDKFPAESVANLPQMGTNQGQPQTPSFDITKVQRDLGKAAFGLPFVIPGSTIPMPPLGGLIQGALERDKGLYAQQAATLDKVLTERGRPRGNVEALPIGKDEKGNAYALARTKTGVQISVQTATGETYALEVAGAGAVKSATGSSPDGSKQPLSDTTINKMIVSAILLGQTARTAPEL